MDKRPELGPAWCFLAAPIAVGLAVGGLVVAVKAEGPTPTQYAGALLTALWAGAGLALGWRRRHERLGPIVLAGAAVAGLVCLSQAMVAKAAADASTNDVAAIALRCSLAALPALAFHM